MPHMLNKTKTIYRTIYLLSLTFNTTLIPKALTLEHAYIQLAQALVADNKPDEALPYYKKTLEHNPNNQEALLQLGVALCKKKDYAHAIVYLEAYTKNNNADKTILAQLSAAYAAQGNFERAAYYQQQLVTLQPSEQEYVHLGDLFLQHQDYLHAIESYNKALEINPKNSTCYLNKAHALQKNGLMKNALETYDQLLTQHKQHPQALIEKAALLTQCGDTDTAIATYQQLMAMAPAPKKISLLYAMGNVQRKGGRLAQAHDLFKTILQQKPTHMHALLGLAKTCITMEDYLHGWQLMAQYNQQAHPHSRSLTHKNQIKGKTIFIGAEWIPEDMIQLVRYAQYVKKAGGTVIVQTLPQLHALFASCPGIDKVIDCTDTHTPAYHAYIPITSLPALFETTNSTVPTDVPYIHPPRELIEEWHTRIHRDTNFKIGIIWKQNDTHCYDPAEQKSIPFALFKPLTEITGISLYCLQPVTEQEYALYGYANLFTLTGSGFPETSQGLLNLAALMKNFDLIITADGYQAHLAGALNIPVWVLLPTRSDYRWHSTHEHSPWYPTMRLFRNTHDNSWETIIKQITVELKKNIQEPS